MVWLEEPNLRLAAQYSVPTLMQMCAPPDILATDRELRMSPQPTLSNLYYSQTVHRQLQFQAPFLQMPFLRGLQRRFPPQLLNLRLGRVARLPHLVVQVQGVPVLPVDTGDRSRCVGLTVSP